MLRLEDLRFYILLVVAGLLNIALFAVDPWQVEQSDRQLDFFDSQGIDKYVNQYALDGDPLSSDRSTGLIAMNAVAALAATTDKAPRVCAGVMGCAEYYRPASGAIMMGWCILWPCFT